ncbi:MAG: SDR family NAD(P)-dependent oxidoreductase [Alphaproteobacteria bacterium]
MSGNGTAVVVGVGPGLGAALCRRFAQGGMNVAAAARDAAKTEKIAADVNALGGGEARGYSVDTTDEAAVEKFFDDVAGDWGVPDAVIYNAGAFMKTSILEATAVDFKRCWEANCYGGFLVGRAAAKRMTPRGSGSILFTGATASKRGSAKFFNLSVGKFGLLALAQAMARELGLEGIHVAHVIIDGQIHSERYAHLAAERPPDALLAPDDIAETYWQLHTQNPSSWAFDVDLRPWVEKF